MGEHLFSVSYNSRCGSIETECTLVALAAECIFVFWEDIVKAADTQVKIHPSISLNIGFSSTVGTLTDGFANCALSEGSCSLWSSSEWALIEWL